MAAPELRAKRNTLYQCPKCGNWQRGKTHRAHNRPGGWGQECKECAAQIGPKDKPAPEMWVTEDWAAIRGDVSNERFLELLYEEGRVCDPGEIERGYFRAVPSQPGDDYYCYYHPATKGKPGACLLTYTYKARYY